jgi:RNA recognition motif-containing protein
MSLFVGNISRSTTGKDIHAFFDKYGKCTVDVKGNFAFVDFESSESAKQAKQALHGKEIFGNVVNIEWSKKGPKKSSKSSHQSSLPSKSSSRNEIECYICRELGHIAKECKNKDKNEGGQRLAIETDVILENLRKERAHFRARIKSPERYSRVMMLSFNTLRILN